MLLTDSEEDVLSTIEVSPRVVTQVQTWCNDASLLRGRCRFLRGVGLGCSLLAACLWLSPVGTASSPASPHVLVPSNVLRGFLELSGLGACPEDGECVSEICFKKCSLLSDGVYPYRDSESTCCKTETCIHSIKTSTVDFYKPMSGPPCNEHRGCLPDEELEEGLCYKKCSLLTNQSLVHRLNADTCCKHKHSTKCALTQWMGDAVTDVAFDVGGGDPPSAPHVPSLALGASTPTTTDKSHAASRLCHSTVAAILAVSWAL